MKPISITVAVLIPFLTGANAARGCGAFENEEPFSCRSGPNYNRDSWGFKEYSHIPRHCGWDYDCYRRNFMGYNNYMPRDMPRDWHHDMPRDMPREWSREMPRDMPYEERHHEYMYGGRCHPDDRNSFGRCQTDGMPDFPRFQNQA